MTATLVAGVVGGPISGALLSLDGRSGLAGWQWLFLIEGVPAIALGFVVLRVLTETPAEAAWLSEEERTALIASLDDGLDRSSADGGAGAALRDGRTWVMAAVYFTIPVTLYGIGFWLPQMLKTASAGASDFTVGLLSAIPYACGAVAMVIVGRHSDRTRERRWHILVPAVVCAIGLVLTPMGSGIVWVVAALSIAMAGLASMFGPFWALATSTMRGASAAAGIALVNSVGNTGGFVGPYLLGAINDATHSFAFGFVVIAAMLVLGGGLVLRAREAD
jgi:MFS family permease